MKNFTTLSIAAIALLGHQARAGWDWNDDHEINIPDIPDFDEIDIDIPDEPDFDDHDFDFPDWDEPVTVKCNIGNSWNNEGEIWGKVVLDQQPAWFGHTQDVKISARFHNLESDNLYDVAIFDNSNAATCMEASTKLFEIGDFESRWSGRGGFRECTSDISLSGENSMLGKHLLVCDDIGPIGCCTMEAWSPFDDHEDHHDD